MIDTHTHIQFKAFEGKVDEVIKSAQKAGIEKIIVVGTNLETSRRAVELAEKYEDLYASIGIHPHHVFFCHAELVSASSNQNGIIQPSQILKRVQDDITALETLVLNPKVAAIGETGLDRHIYESTRYKNYQITDEFIKLQKLFFMEQIRLAIKHKKSLIIHNRKAVPELLEILEANWDHFLEGRSVFHCCEPNQELLDFALTNKVFIGIDGDITYDKKKQEFIKKVPLELLVLETDSPYFIPEPLRSALRHPQADDGSINNEPKNLKIIVEFIANLKNLDLNDLENITNLNSNKLLGFN